MTAKEKKVLANKAYRESNKEKIAEQKKAYREANKEKLKAQKDAYYQANKEKKKAYQEARKELKREYDKQYRETDREYQAKRKRDYTNKRKKVDPVYKLTLNIRRLILHAFTNHKYSKKSKTFEILGCSYEDFKAHIEKQFVDGMSWENQGQWHLDHKRPISLAVNEQEVYELNHYTNFQPLWAKDNLKKSNK